MSLLSVLYSTLCSSVSRRGSFKGWSPLANSEKKKLNQPILWPFQLPIPRKYSKAPPENNPGHKDAMPRGRILASIHSRKDSR